MTQAKRITQLLAITASAFVISACGSSSSSTPVATPPADPLIAGTDLPQSTTTTGGAFTFVKQTSDAASETGEPLGVGDAVLATSETDEPDGSV